MQRDRLAFANQSRVLFTNLVKKPEARKKIATGMTRVVNESRANISR
jgi:hypothetical protein